MFSVGKSGTKALSLGLSCVLLPSEQGMVQLVRKVKTEPAERLQN